MPAVPQGWPLLEPLLAALYCALASHSWTVGFSLVRASYPWKVCVVTWCFKTPASASFALSLGRFHARLFRSLAESGRAQKVATLQRKKLWRRSMKRMMDEIDQDGAPFLVPRTYTGMGCSIHRKTSMSTPTLQLCKRTLSSKSETDPKKNEFNVPYQSYAGTLPYQGTIQKGTLRYKVP